MITILGPTASGKTEIACHLAKELDAEIISADSRQIYKGMDIGTGKDLAEYNVDGVSIPVHLIDIKDPGYKYNIAEYQSDFHRVHTDITNRGKNAILCGGSGLYIETALRGSSFLGIPFDDEQKKHLLAMDSSDFEDLYTQSDIAIKKSIGSETKQRKARAIQVSQFLKLNPEWVQRDFPEVETIIFGVNIDRELRREKITNRLSERLNNGLIEEAKNLLENGLSHVDMAYYGLEYKWLSDYLLNKINKKELFFGLNTAIHQFSKRQMTWYRRMEKQGYVIHWIHASDDLRSKVDQIIEIYGR